MSDDLRRLIAEANRLMWMEGLAAASGHASALDPDSGNVLVNPFDTPRGALRPEHVVAATVENEPVDPDATEPVDELEIHTAIYRARDDVGAVVHAHPSVATLFGIAGVDLVPVYIRGSLIEGPVPVFDRPDKITSLRDGERMLEAMGEQRQLLIRGHGLVVADRDVPSAFVRAAAIEENARYQLYASILGDPIPFSEEESARLGGQNTGERSAAKRWGFYRWKARQQGLLPIE